MVVVIERLLAAAIIIALLAVVLYMMARSGAGVGEIKDSTIALDAVKNNDNFAIFSNYMWIIPASISAIGIFIGFSVRSRIFLGEMTQAKYICLRYILAKRIMMGEYGVPHLDSKELTNEMLRLALFAAEPHVRHTQK